MPGGVHLQCPRIVTDAETAICRLAWLPDDETLLRVEAGVKALEPLVEDDMMIGFAPPSLVSLRCDMFKKTGELENVPRPSRDWAPDKDEEDKKEPVTSEKTETTTPPEESPSSEKVEPKKPSPVAEKKDEAGDKPIRDSLSL